jgi:hypothetical protein
MKVTDLLATTEPVIRGWIAEQIGDNAASNNPNDQFDFEWTAGLGEGDTIRYDATASNWVNTSWLSVQSTDISLDPPGELIFLEGLTWIESKISLGAGPQDVLKFNNVGNSPAVIGDGVIISFHSDDTHLEEMLFAEIRAITTDVTSGAAEGYISMFPAIAGTPTETARFTNTGLLTSYWVAVGEGALLTGDRWIDVDGSLSASAENYGILSSPSLGSAQALTALYGRADVDASIAATTLTGLKIKNPQMGGAATAVTAQAIYIEEQTVGSSNNYSILFDPGSDKDMNILTVNVTGAPTIIWDESEDAFNISSGLNVAGSMVVTGGITYDGAIIIDVTSTEALLVRKDGDTGDVFIIDTTNARIEFWADAQTDRWLSDDSNTFLGVGVLGAGNLAHTIDVTGWQNVALGYQSLYSLTTGSRNLGVGYQAGFSTTAGNYNNFFGSEAGYTNSTGGGNNFFGYRTGYTNSTGAYNNFFGYRTGFTNSSGVHNNFFGPEAGYTNSTGGSNNFFGYQAGYTNSTGGGNNFFGYRTGYTNSTGAFNNFFGYQAGQTNSTGGSNNFFGYRTGYTNSTGAYNNFFGYQAGYLNSIGTFNNFFGYQAGQTNSTGGGNNFFGYRTGFTNSSGEHNNFFGSEAGYTNSTGAYNNFFGYQAGYLNGIGAYNNFFGYQAGFSTTAGNYNILLGYRAGDVITTGSYNIIIGYDIDPTGATVSSELNIGGVIFGTLTANQNITINAPTISTNYDLMLAGDGVLGLKETITPTADADYGKVYTKADNKIYFQDGAGTEHEFAFV